MTEPAPSPNSPLPWTIDEFGDIRDAEGFRVITTALSRKAIASTKLIVEAVNTHATLAEVAALQLLVRTLARAAENCFAGRHGGDWDVAREAVLTARAALAPKGARDGQS